MTISFFTIVLLVPIFWILACVIETFWQSYKPRNPWECDCQECKTEQNRQEQRSEYLNNIV